MQVHHAATMQLESIQANASIREAAEKMREANIGLLLIAEGTELVGVLTDRDIVLRAVAPTGCVGKVTARNIMSRPVICIQGDADLDKAVHLMAENRVRRLVVLNLEKVPVGVLSLDDIAFSTHGDDTAGQVLEELSHAPLSAAQFPSG